MSLNFKTVKPGQVLHKLVLPASVSTSCTLIQPVG